jgi:hypothetical protein
MLKISDVIAAVALVVSVVTAWLTLFQKGTLKMTRPTVVFFGPDGPGGEGGLKVYLRTLLYSTARRAHIVESMYVRLSRGEAVQNFNIWTYGDSGRLARGSGVRVGEDGVTCNNHYLLPMDGTLFRFLPGEYKVEVYATVVNRQASILLWSTRLSLSPEQSAAIDHGSGVYFDWGPDSKRYHAHINPPPNIINAGS